MFIPLEVKTERIADIVTNALEGGSNYWYMLESKKEPSSWIFTSFPDLEIEEGKHWLCDYPLNPGGALMISNDYNRERGDKKVTKKLNIHALKNGLKIMAEKYPAHFGDFLSEHDDGDTADVFLQCCLFGEVIYG